MVLHENLVDEEQHAMLPEQAREIDAGRIEKLAARALHERKVLGVEHDTAGVGVLEVHPDRNPERALQWPDSRSRAAAGATMPKWRDAGSVALRPRSGLCTEPCSVRNRPS